MITCRRERNFEVNGERRRVRIEYFINSLFLDGTVGGGVDCWTTVETGRRDTRENK